MREQAKDILQELNKKYQVTDEMIAVKVDKTSSTIWRWRKGKTNPSKLELKLLQRTLKDYQNVTQKKS